MNRRNLLLAGIPLGILGLFLAVYGINRALTSDVIGRNVTVGGVAVAGMTVADAELALADHATRLTVAQIPVTAGADSGEISPMALGLGVDVAGGVEEAFAVGRSGSFFSDLGSWIGRLNRPHLIPLPVTVDATIFEAGLGHLDRHLIGDPAFDGAIEIIAGEPVATHPRSGTEVDRATARDALVDAFAVLDRQRVRLDVVDRPALVTDADVDRAVIAARSLLDGGVVLTSDDERSLSLSRDDLADAFTFGFSDSEPVRMEVGFDEAVLLTKVEDDLEGLTTNPESARFILNRDSLEASVRPGRPGTAVDTDTLADAIDAAARTTTRRGRLPIVETAQPEVTTEYLEGLGVKHMVSRFTTYHAGGEDRVKNIHRIADLTRLAIVPPGAQFDLNAHVGRRTPERGFVQAGGILGGEILNDIYGGGVSQFTTTLYNAVFWGGYEDVRHKPHSLYFTRYPRGIEATIDYDSVPFIFRNDTNKGIVINTAYSNTAITVEIWGDNDGRAIAGHHQNGSTSTWVVREGGPNARRVTVEVSEPLDVKEPTEILEGNPDVTPGNRRRIENGIAGFRVNIRRTITQGSASSTLNWSWTYDMKPARYEVHPCELPGGAACPEPTTTTTTTVPDDTTTTTTSPETTTTTEPPETTTST